MITKQWVGIGRDVIEGGESRLVNLVSGCSSGCGNGICGGEISNGGDGNGSDLDCGGTLVILT